MSVLIWTDIETTGLVPSQGEILEISLVATTDDKFLDEIDRVSYVIHRPELFDVNGEPSRSLDDWIRKVHFENGLLQDCTDSNNTLETVELDLINFVRGVYHKNAPHSSYKSPLCGSSVHFDRSWLELYCPKLMRLFTYRNIDVSSFHEVANRSTKDFSSLDNVTKISEHRSLSDILKSIERLRGYRKLLDF